MKTIWKFPLVITNQQTIKLPKNAYPLSVQIQRGELCFWAIVDTEEPTVERNLWIVGTGNPYPSTSALMYIGTVQMESGVLVWHVFLEFEEFNHPNTLTDISNLTRRTKNEDATAERT